LQVTLEKDMISAPIFDLSREKTWVLRIGVVFFALLALLLVVSALLPYLPRPSRKPRAKSDLEIRLEQQGIRLPSTEELARRPGPGEDEQKSRLPWAICDLCGALILAGGTVLPIARELRRRRRGAVVDGREN
jgi:hypothetical protein